MSKIVPVIESVNVAGMLMLTLGYRYSNCCEWVILLSITQLTLLCLEFREIILPPAIKFEVLVIANIK